MTETLKRRTLDLATLTLEKGAHQADHTFCVMEAVAFIAGESWSDTPHCVSPAIGAFLRNWNDSVDDAFRQRLKPYIERVPVGFGDACVTRDGIEVYREPTGHHELENPDREEGVIWDFVRAEQEAAKDPDHDWRAVLFGPLHGETYQRQDGKWLLVEKNEGFA